MIAEQLGAVRARVERAAALAGRDKASVHLVAVSKNQPALAIREAYAAGQRAFGENYAQELEEKRRALADLSDIEWHFIGHLQTNKAKIVARAAHVVHTVDSVVLARELAKRVRAANGARLPILVEVNIGGEAQKHGAAPSEIGDVIGAVRELPELDLRGLMTMPPAGDVEVARKIFQTLVTLRNLHGGERELPELSMGMSGDLEVAIACGATLVRVGTAIFGPRKPQ
jgi:pyridoxal phosphate enzyme (YggS family)